MLDIHLHNRPLSTFVKIFCYFVLTRCVKIMANTYSQIYFHIVIAVRNRDGLIHSSFRTELYQFITGVIRNHGQKLLAIGGMPDHVHLFIGTVPNLNLSDFIRIVKSNSSKWINDKKMTKCKFFWQEGFGAFTHSKKEADRVIRYIHSQEEHHRLKSFRDEYVLLLTSAGVEFDNRYIFEDLAG